MDLSKIELPKTGHSRFYIGLTLFFIIVFLRNVLLIPIPVVTVLVLNVCLIFVFSVEEIVALFVCYIPLEATFQFKYGILVCVAAFLIKNKFKLHGIGKSYGFWIILMMVWELFHFVIVDFSINEYFRSIAELAFLFLVVMHGEKVDFKFISKCLVITTCFIGTSMLLNLMLKNGFSFSSVFLVQDYRLGVINENIGISNLNYNANQLGFIFCLSILTQLIKITKLKSTATDYILLFYLVFLGLLTKSRSFLVCLLFSFLLYIIFQMNKGNSNRRTNVYRVLLLCLTFAILINIFAPGIIGQYIDRFSVDDVSNARNNIFSSYHSLIKNGPLVMLFGLGLQNLTDKISILYGIDMIQVPHNGFQQILVMWGIPGLVMFAIFLKDMIQYDMVKKDKILHMSLLLLMILSCMFGQLIDNSTKLMSLTYILVLMRYDFEDEYVC